MRDGQNIPATAPYARRGWRLKIRDRERVEPPHVTVLFRTHAWRSGLSERSFLDRQPDPGAIPSPIIDFIEQNLPRLIEAWDELYPHNKVRTRKA